MRLSSLLLFLLILLINSSCQSTTQITPVTIDHPYQFPEEILAKMAQDTTLWKYEPAAWAYSEIGDFDNTLINWDSSREMLARNFGYFFNTDTVDLSRFKSNYQPKNAKSVILERAMNNRVLMINEGHHLPNHRNFTRSLLQDLWNIGYRHLGLEAIKDDLVEMHQLGYPTYDVGNYTKEPQFGELIREALAIGFQVFGYDSDYLYDEAREIDQAKGIHEVLLKNPNDKVLIHCGFGHLYENPKSRLLGFHFAQLSKINPLTVNQYDYSERHSTKYEHPVFSNLVKEQSVVYVDKNGKDFNRPTADSLNEDILVFHPRTNYKNNRPVWLEDTERKLTKIDLPEKLPNGTCLVLAIPIQESIERAIPVDIVAVTPTDNAFVYMALKKGKYQIIVQNQEKEGLRFEFERQ